MNKVFNLLKRHKILTVVCLVTVVFISIMGYVFLSVFISGNNKYGDRLDGIEEVRVSKNKMNEVVNKLKEKGEVSDASARVQGKIIYVNIIFNDDVSLDSAKGIATDSLSEFSDEEKKFYDFGYFLTQNKEDGYNVTGSMHGGSDKISFIRS